MHHHRLRYDDFWTTGIWVGLRIFLLPLLVLGLFYLVSNTERFGVAAQTAKALGPLDQALAQISAGMGGTSGSSWTRPGPGAKWLRP